jgi:hypothetical protein
MIVSIETSSKKNKRYMAVMKNGRSYDFGLKDGSTFIDGENETTRDNYRKRHYTNPKEKYLIDNLIPSPALFSYSLLWGASRDIHNNIKSLNRLWKLRGLEY